MTRRPKDIGTEGEVATVACARVSGFPHAKRLVLEGSNDQGDVCLGDGVSVTIEVKWGKEAETAAPGQIDDWLEETDVERVHAGNEVGILIIKRKGFGKSRLDECWAFMSLDTAAWLCAKDTVGEVPGFPVRMLVRDAFYLLRWAGYGWPNELVA